MQKDLVDEISIFLCNEDKIILDSKQSSYFIYCDAPFP